MISSGYHTKKGVDICVFRCIVALEPEGEQMFKQKPRIERATVNVPIDIHREAQDAGYADGRITVGIWIAEAICYYLTLKPADRDAFRAKIKDK